MLVQYVNSMAVYTSNNSIQEQYVAKLSWSQQSLKVYQVLLELLADLCLGLQKTYLYPIQPLDFFPFLSRNALVGLWRIKKEIFKQYLDIPTRCQGTLKLTSKMTFQTCEICCSDPDEMYFLFIAFCENVSTYLNKVREKKN